VVPQGPGILNLSLAYPCDGGPGFASVQVYAHLCGLLATALGRLGIDTATAAVEGSFCDGRYNLAVAVDGGMRKIAGTAQYWRRSGDRHVVLAHALLLVQADPRQLCDQANHLEAALGSSRRYRSQALTNVAQAWQAAHPGQALPEDLSGSVKRHIVAALID
jgi:lipoate-protein ligase A